MEQPRVLGRQAPGGHEADGGTLGRAERRHQGARADRVLRAQDYLLLRRAGLSKGLLLDLQVRRSVIEHGLFSQNKSLLMPYIGICSTGIKCT